jgi:CheY-like chemotaxis protein
MPSLLLIDDSDQMRRMIRRVIADLADPIFECEGGTEVLAAYARHRRDCVLMDIEMPEMDGLTATRRLLELFPEARVVIVTQYDDDRLRDAAREAGAVGHVLKENLLELRARLQP